MNVVSGLARELAFTKKWLDNSITYVQYLVLENGGVLFVL